MGEIKTGKQKTKQGACSNVKMPRANMKIWIYIKGKETSHCWRGSSDSKQRLVWRG